MTPAPTKLLRKNAVFRFRPGARRLSRRVDVQAIGRALADMYLQDGTVKASDYVERARDPDHPFHETLQWDDSKAAHEHRLQQARTIISAIEVIVEPRDEPATSIGVPLFFHVPATSGGRVVEGDYRTLDDVIRDPADLAAATLALMQRRDTLELRLRHLKHRVEQSPDDRIRARAASLQVALASLDACKMALAQSAAEIQ